MWPLVSILAELIGRNNPQANRTLNTALQISGLFGNGGAKKPSDQ